MKEITRIHIAKVAYDIELDAKKDIQKYMGALEQYAEDTETLDDIEIRITELLAECGVVAGGVISADDVAAVRAQLGEPSDFASEGVGDIAVGNEEGRRFYRDEDSALLGGVLAGISRYFGLNPIWARLLFIALAIGSFGTILIVYIILWLVIPPARTAAEKLRMDGKPVTLESIKKLGEQAEPVINRTAIAMKNILVVGTGIALVVMAIGALIATVVIGGGFFLGLGTSDNSPFASFLLKPDWTLVLGFALFIVSGLLLSALGFVLANATFRRRWSKRIGVSVVAIIAAGLLSFASGVGTVIYVRWQGDVQYDSRFSTVSNNLPEGFRDVKQLTIGSSERIHQYVNVEYIVSKQSRYELEAPREITPRITIGDDGVSANIVITSTDNQDYWGGRFYVSLKVYGPALESIAVKDGTVSYRGAARQDALSITSEASSFTLTGTYGVVRVHSKETGLVELDGATVEELDVQLDGGRVSAGVVRTLTVRQPDACPAREDEESLARLDVQAVSSGKILYNGNEQAVKNIKNGCGWVSFAMRDREED
ncbi:MAG TPA: PspC domain-containing protein [Candidatus Saccharibacteria bacterium]|nr:PspC domain-containing protein [Candidatus Saccharibacteria bacterium]